MKLFFKDISNFWANWPNRLNKFWGICIFGLTKYQHPFGHCRSLLYDFYHSDVFSAKPITQIYHKYDIGHKEFGYSHHAFVVGSFFYNSGNQIKGAKVISGMMKPPGAIYLVMKIFGQSEAKLIFWYLNTLDKCHKSLLLPSPRSCRCPKRNRFAVIRGVSLFREHIVIFSTYSKLNIPNTFKRFTLLLLERFYHNQY